MSLSQILDTETLTVTVSVADNIELLTHVLSGITIILIPDQETKYRTVWLNAGHPATLIEIYFQICTCKYTYRQTYIPTETPRMQTPCRQIHLSTSQKVPVNY